MEAAKTVLDPFNLAPIWDALLAVYSEFAKVCDAHGLRYYASDGTVLGAIRHGGYIPWDDDLDFSMPRPDYDRFVELCRQGELPAHLKFVYWKNTPEFSKLFGKLQDSRESVVHAVEAKCGRKLSNGIYIDILPIDGYPDDDWYGKWIKVRDKLFFPMERFRMHRFSQLSWKGKTAWLVGMVESVFVFWMNKPWHFQSKHEMFLRKYPFESADYVGRTGRGVNLFRRPPEPKGLWGVPQRVKFYNTELPMPQDWENHLRREFSGDRWRELPPESQRHPGHAFDWYYPWAFGPTLHEEVC